MPRHALEHRPSWPDLTLSQSRHNLARLRRQCLIDTDVSILSSSVNRSTAGSRTAAQQERDFHRAVQPGSPLSVLLTSAKQPLVVASGMGGGTGASPHRPVGGLYKKLAAAAPSLDTSTSSTSTRGFGNMRSPVKGGGLATLVEMDEEAVAAKEAKDLRNRTRELESQKARIVAQMAPDEDELEQEDDNEDTAEQVQAENVPPVPSSRLKERDVPISKHVPPPIGAERRVREVLKPQSAISTSSSYPRSTETSKAQSLPLPPLSSGSAISSSRALPSSSSITSSSRAAPSYTSSSHVPPSSRPLPSSSKYAAAPSSSASRKSSEIPPSTSSSRVDSLTSAMSSTKITSGTRSAAIPNINCEPPPNPPVMLKVHGFDETAKTLAEAFDALDNGLVYRSGGEELFRRNERFTETLF